MKAALAQLSETPCLTVQVKVTTSPGHAAVLPSCSTLDTNVTSATMVMKTCNLSDKSLLQYECATPIWFLYLPSGQYDIGVFVAVFCLVTIFTVDCLPSSPGSFPLHMREERTW